MAKKPAFDPQAWLDSRPDLKGRGGVAIPSPNNPLPVVSGNRPAGPGAFGAPAVPAAGSFAMSGQGAITPEGVPYLYGSGNLNDPNRQQVPVLPAEEVQVPDYMAIFNDMLAAMTPPKPQMSFDASPYQNALGLANQQAQIGQQAIGQTQEGLMASLAALRDQMGVQGQQNLAAMQQGQQGVQQNIQNAINPVAADLAAQGVSAQLGGGARAAALQQQQGAQMNRANTLQAAGMAGMGDRLNQATALGQSANQNLQRNLGAATAAIEQDQLKAQTAAQNDYIRALNSWQSGRAGDAKSVLSMIADALPDDDNVASEWAEKTGPTADKVAESFVLMETQGLSPETILGEGNKDQWVLKLGRDGQPEKDSKGNDKYEKVTGWEIMRREGIDVESYKQALRNYGKPKKPSKQQRAIGAIYGGK